MTSMAGRIAFLLRCLAAAFSVIAAMGTAHAEKRVALVIGNSAYQHARVLANPTNDARLMADTLTSLGFFVVGGGAKLDLDKAGFDTAIGEFEKALVGADAALFYYAGHGVETHGLNYLVPIDTNPADDGDVFMQAVGLADILDKIDRAGARINLLLLDACRDNPFRDRGVHSTTGGLAQMQATTVTAPIRARSPIPSPIPATACSRPSTRSGLRWRRRPMTSNCRGFRCRRFQAISISPARQARLPALRQSSKRGSRHRATICGVSPIATAS